MPVVFTVFFFITVITLGPLLIIFGYLHLRRRNIDKTELREIRNEMARMKADIEELKEQLADFIIRTN
jgi:uncharacterized membrane protein (DUF106 family)